VIRLVESIDKRLQLLNNQSPWWFACQRKWSQRLRWRRSRPRSWIQIQAGSYSTLICTKSTNHMTQHKRWKRISDERITLFLYESAKTMLICLRNWPSLQLIYYYILFWCNQSTMFSLLTRPLSARALGHASWSKYSAKPKLSDPIDTNWVGYSTWFPKNNGCEWL